MVARRWRILRSERPISGRRSSQGGAAALREDYRGVELERGYVAFLRLALLQAVRSTEAEFAETIDLRTVLEKRNPDSARATAR